MADENYTQTKNLFQFHSVALKHELKAFLIQYPRFKENYPKPFMRSLKMGDRWSLLLLLLNQVFLTLSFPGVVQYFVIMPNGEVHTILATASDY